MEFCPHCMSPTVGKFCGSCGKDMNWTPLPNQLPLGTQLRGSSGTVYSVGAAKGQGGFGITYAAMDLRTGKRVAIKEYYPTRCALRTYGTYVRPMGKQEEIFLGGKKSFLEEAMMLRAVCALPSVVSVRDYFEANGTAYIVMEYVDGEPLHKVVQRKGPMSPEQLLPKLPQLLHDLQIMHEAGVIHRDISPDNLILMPNGALKLLDFGSARSMQDGKSMTVMLKAGFSPVEQYQSKGQGPYTDVYALAATIYFCLTGAVPEAAINRLGKQSDPLLPPNQKGARLTPRQEQAILRGMTVQPKSRPQTMKDFSRDLFPKGGGVIIDNGGKDGGGKKKEESWIPGLDNKTFLIILVVAGGLLAMLLMVLLILSLTGSM